MHKQSSRTGIADRLETPGMIGNEQRRETGITIFENMSNSKFGWGWGKYLYWYCYILKYRY